MTGDNLDLADPAEAARCRSLWAAVALHALADAAADPTGPAGRYLDSADFRAVLSLADLDADAAVERIEALRRERAEAGGGIRSPQPSTPGPVVALEKAKSAQTTKRAVK